MALLAGSPAIDQGSSFGLTVDQRGRRRPFRFPMIANPPGDGSDIGAFEANPPLLSIARATTNVVLSWSSGDSGYILQGRTNITSGTWGDLLGTATIAGNRYYQTNTAVSNKIYRLRSQ